MGLALHAIKTLAPHLKSARVLSLGYPDILATAEEVEEIFGVKPTSTIEAGEQHGIKRPLVETVELLKLIGSTLECVDVIKWRGFERVLDLNEPHDLGDFDLVIDPGTTEHCFNIGQAIMNAANAVRVGGRIYHSPPLFMVNHGFYNVCPTALWDFYDQNCWRMEVFEARQAKGDGFVRIDEKSAVARGVKVGPETGLCFMAQRLSARKLKWPIQKKYVLMSAHKAAA